MAFSAQLADGTQGVYRADPRIEVAIDIKPGSFPNSINLGSRGTVPVGIVSTTAFDTTTIDPTSVTPAGATVALKGKGTSMAAFQDVNGEWKIRSGSGNKKMCILSTELTEACGGYAISYIYTIHFPNLQPVPWAAAMTGRHVKQQGTTPILMMGANTVDVATIMAIMSPKMMYTKEIAFFTSIPTNYITDCRRV